jgi:hypothetical protein
VASLALNHHVKWSQEGGQSTDELTAHLGYYSADLKRDSDIVSILYYVYSIAIYKKGAGANRVAL